MRDEVMNFDTVVKSLIKEIPELKPSYEKELRWCHCEGLDAITVFEYVLNPYLVDLLRVNEDKELISRIFNFLEKMTTCDEYLIKEFILEHIVLERLTKNIEILTKSKEYMGKETKRICDEASFFNYNTVDKELIKKIPEIKSFYNEKFKDKYIEEPDKYRIFKEVLNPYLISLLEVNENEELILRVFDFLEKMAKSDDYRLKKLLELTVLIDLERNVTIIRKAEKYMGNETKKIGDNSKFINDVVEAELIEEIPEIESFYYNKLVRCVDKKPKKNIIWEEVLNSYLVNLLATNEDEELIQRIFDLLEKKAVCEHKKMYDLLRYLGYDEAILKKSKRYMGEETKKICNETEKVLGKVMIPRENVMELLINVCPSFKGKWEEYLEDDWDRDRETILYSDLSVFARYLTELTMTRKFEELYNLFDEIERLIKEGDFFVSEAIVVGLLEDFQNGLLSNGYELNIMDEYLKPDTKRGWLDLIKFWNSMASKNPKGLAEQ